MEHLQPFWSVSWQYPWPACHRCSLLDLCNLAHESSRGREPNADSHHVQGHSTGCTAEGLRPGCTYRVRVCAYNAVGEGAYSVPVDISTAPDVASQPSAPHATQRWQHALQLAWKPSQHDGGLPIQAYRLEGSRGQIFRPC